MITVDAEGQWDAKDPHKFAILAQDPNYPNAFGDLASRNFRYGYIE
jgi:hypothetical protein